MSTCPNKKWPTIKAESASTRAERGHAARTSCWLLYSSCKLFFAITPKSEFADEAHAESISDSASAGTPAPRGEQHLNDNGKEWVRLKIKEWWHHKNAAEPNEFGPMRRGLWKCSLPSEPTFTTTFVWLITSVAWNRSVNFALANLWCKSAANLQASKILTKMRCKLVQICALF